MDVVTFNVNSLGILLEYGWITIFDSLSANSTYHLKLGHIVTDKWERHVGGLRGILN